jgi:hypothetical protein
LAYGRLTDGREIPVVRQLLCDVQPSPQFLGIARLQDVLTSLGPLQQARTRREPLCRVQVLCRAQSQTRYPCVNNALIHGRVCEEFPGGKGLSRRVFRIHERGQKRSKVGRRRGLGNNRARTQVRALMGCARFCHVNTSGAWSGRVGFCAIKQKALHPDLHPHSGRHLLAPRHIEHGPNVRRLASAQPARRLVVQRADGSLQPPSPW